MGADIRARDVAGGTPLHRAANKGHAHTVWACFAENERTGRRIPPHAAA
jgi:ankyrin repeat protein